jgi:CRISPR system Cascade subunit CasD
LCDASFLVAVQSTPETISLLARFVQFPIWQVYLGRKSCVPARPLYDGVGDYISLQEALEQWAARFLDRIEARFVDRYPRMVIECDVLEPGSVRRRVQLTSRAYWLHEPCYLREIRMQSEITVIYLDKGE